MKTKYLLIKTVISFLFDSNLRHIIDDVFFIEKRIFFHIIECIDWGKTWLTNRMISLFIYTIVTYTASGPGQITSIFMGSRWGSSIQTKTPLPVLLYADFWYNMDVCVFESKTQFRDRFAFSHPTFYSVLFDICNSTSTPITLSQSFVANRAYRLQRLPKSWSHTKRNLFALPFHEIIYK